MRQLEYSGSDEALAGRGVCSCSAEWKTRRLALLPCRELRRVMEHVILVQVVSRELLLVLEELKTEGETDEGEEEVRGL